MRFSRSGWTMLAMLAIVAVMSQVTLAQREEGRRGGRGGGFGGGGGVMSGARLVTLEPVEKALKLTDEQKDKIKDINEKMREDMRKAFDGDNPREKMQELNANTAAELNKVLDEGQQKRLMGILVQVAGAAATSDPAVAKELNVTEDQKTKMKEVRDSVREEFGKLRDQNLSREEMTKKVQEIQADVNKKILAVLTSDQQSQLESLKGEKVEIDMAALRGGGRGGDRQRGGERGGRGRGERNPESKSNN